MNSETIQSKLPDVGTSIFTEMSMLANECGAINLSQGFPEFDAPEFLKSAFSKAIENGQNQYAPSMGMPQLLTQIEALISEHYQKQIDASKMVTVTSGATEALFVAIQSIVRPGDEVILFDPAYDSYHPAIELAQGVPVHVALRAPDYKVDWQQVAQKVTDKTRLIIINTPHNPTATLLSHQDMLALQKLVVENQLYLISDEVYEFITFDELTHHSVLGYPELFARAYVISSFGKTFHCTGWKMGYAVAPAELTEEFRKLHQFVTFSTNTPGQVATAQMLSEHPKHISQLAGFYQDKRNCLVDALQASRFKLLPSSGTYFLLADYSEISDLADKEFCQWLTREHGVAAIPLSPFYQSPPGEKVIRLCFAKKENTLVEAAKKLCRL